MFSQVLLVFLDLLALQVNKETIYSFTSIVFLYLPITSIAFITLKNLHKEK